MGEETTPLEPSEGDIAKRGSDGRFGKGNKAGRLAKGKHPRRSARGMLDPMVSDDDYRVMFQSIIKSARKGSVKAVDFILERTCGKVVEPDLDDCGVIDVPEFDSPQAIASFLRELAVMQAKNIISPIKAVMLHDLAMSAAKVIGGQHTNDDDLEDGDRAYL